MKRFLKILNEETAKHFEKFEIENFSPENWLGVDQKEIAQILEEGYSIHFLNSTIYI